MSSNVPPILLAPIIYPLLAIVGLAILVYKRKARKIELVAVSLSVLAGFLFGLFWPGYGNMGLAQMGAIIGLTLSSAVLTISRALRK